MSPFLFLWTFFYWLLGCIRVLINEGAQWVQSQAQQEGRKAIMLEDLVSYPHPWYFDLSFRVLHYQCLPSFHCFLNEFDYLGIDVQFHTLYHP